MLKSMGKIFISLKQRNEDILKQRILVVDNGYCLIEQIRFAVDKVNNSFPDGEIWVLTMPERKHLIETLGLGSIRYITGYRIPLQMFRMRNNRFNWIVLLSLDILPIAVSLIFMRARVLLYNRWAQWWDMRFKALREIIFSKNEYVKDRKLGLSNLIKRIGLKFIWLNRRDERILSVSVLIVDNDNESPGQITQAVYKVKKLIPSARIFIAGEIERVELKERFPDIELIELPGKFARCLFALRLVMFYNKDYDYIMPLSLDEIPLIIAALFMRTRIILYNRWHQWWILKPRTLKDFIIPMFTAIISPLIFVYLLFYALFMSFQRVMNILLYGSLRRG